MIEEKTNSTRFIMIKRLILILIVCGLFLCALSSCKNPDNTEPPEAPEQTDPTLKEEREEIKNLFSFLQSEADAENKVSFEVQYQNEHYSFKQSGEYADSFWFSSSVLVTVLCDYGFAREEDWYLSAENEGSKALNQAFFDAHSDTLSNEYFSLLDGVQGLHFDYTHNDADLSDVLEDFYADYEGISALYGLEYVRSVKIVYFYSMPDAYFDN